MKSFSLLLITMLGLTLLSGCLGAKQGTEAMERELRHQEKKIWTYTSYIEDYQRLLDDCRGENERLRERLGEDAEGGTRRPRLRDGNTESDGIFELEIEEGIEVQPEDLGTDEMSSEEGPSLHSSNRFRTETFAAESGRLRNEPAETEEREHSRQQAPVEPPVEPPAELATEMPETEIGDGEFPNSESQDVQSLTLDTLFTGGNNTDGVPGDEGISLLIETRNVQGDVVLPEGDLDISLLDPAAANESEARVGLWRLTANEVRQKFRDSGVGKGVLLQMPWQHKPPKREDLRLFLRFTRPDGERIQTDHDFNIELPGRTAAERRQRRRRFFTALAEPSSDSTRPGGVRGLRRLLPGATSEQNTSSAPLWNGGALQQDDSSATAETGAAQRSEPSTPPPSRWSRSQRSIPTRATPERLSREITSEDSAAKRGSLRTLPTRSAAAPPRVDSDSRGANSTEPKVVVESHESVRSRGSKPPQVANPPERTAIKPRPWSPYR